MLSCFLPQKSETFARFLMFNQAVFCVDDGVVLWLKIKNPTTTTFFMPQKQLVVECETIFKKS